MEEEAKGYVIIVDESVLDGAVEMQAVANAALTESLSDAVADPVNSQALPKRELLELRKSALMQVAHGIANPEDRIETMGVADGALERGLPRIAASKTVYAAPDGMRVMEGVGAILVDSDDIDIDAINNHPGVAVYPNVLVQMTAPDEEGASMDAGDVEAMDAGAFWHLNQVGLSSGEPGGEGIVIGVLDTGIDEYHPEFEGKAVHFAEFDMDGKPVDGPSRDAGSHGTHVSSIAAGNRFGAAPDADLAVAAVLTYPDPYGRLSGYLKQIVAGMNWMVTSRFVDGRVGADIVNASLGGSGYNNYLEQTVLTASGAGIPMVAAIGNDGRKGEGFHGSPGNYSTTISVGASGSYDIVAIFSDWQIGGPDPRISYPLPDLSAPGVDVLAAVPGGQYSRKSGTSMATPIVTGIAARRMADTPGLLRRPRALKPNLLAMLGPVAPHPTNRNFGGAGRIRA